VDDVQRRVRLEALFSEHARTVRAYALRRTDPTTADDVVAEVFVVAWRRLDDLPPDPLPWLLRCARNTLSNAQRSQRRRGALAQRLAAEPHIETRGDGRLADALAALRPADRELLLLIAWDGLSPEQAASALGCSRGTLAVRLHRARRRLRRALDAEPATLPTTTLEPER
jgi:RNA polymerase sigma-70 factor (ECF subfamily)